MPESRQNAQKRNGRRFTSAIFPVVHRGNGDIVGAVGFELGDIIVHPGDQRIIVFVGNRLIVHIASRQLLGKNFIEDRVFVICNRLVDAAVGKCARRNILSVPPFDERRHAVFPAEGEKLGFHLIVVGETVVARALS